MTWHRPTFVSERESAHTWPDGRYDDAKWEDCGPCSTLMAIDATTAGAKPAAHNRLEAEALRAAAGYPPTGGTNIQRLAATAVVRYHVSLPRYLTGFAAIWSALRPGYGAAVAGSMAAFGPTHRLSRHAPWYQGGHAVYVQRETATDRVLWMDPLAPNGYTGEWVSKAELAAFLGHGIAAACVVPLKEA